MGIKSALKRGMANRAGRQGEIVEVEWLSASLRRIVWSEPQTPELRVGDKIKVHVGEGAMRSYTPSAIDAVNGRLEMIAHVHGHGVGSDWARDLGVGDTITYMGPAKSFVLGDNPAPWAVFYGDETAIGLAKVLVSHSGVERILGAIELEEASQGVVEASGLELDEVTKHEGGETGLVAHLEALEFPEGRGEFWLSGEASSILALRESILNMGVGRDQIRLKAYWSMRGKAHRKELERGALKR